MKHTIIIDDSTKAGAGLLEIARSMAKLYKSVKVEPLSSEEESPYSKQFVKKIQRSLASKGKAIKTEDLWK
ncbi:MAG: DUF2683 family protein [Mangrovibacterium sp.]